LSEARHFIILFRDHRLQFRAVYIYIPETDVIEKLHGLGPNIITEIMVEKWFKYVLTKTNRAKLIFLSFFKI
jgi:calmodulin-regulated spectrin-associated protein